MGDYDERGTYHGSPARRDCEVALPEHSLVNIEDGGAKAYSITVAVGINFQKIV